jgi:hypothetical protein
MSPTGQKMLATANVDGDTSVYYSSDYGGSWEQVTAAPDLNYRGFAASEDWTKLAAAPLNGTLYTVAITNLLATAAPPYIRTAGGFLYIQEAGVWKKTALSALNAAGGTVDAPTIVTALGIPTYASLAAANAALNVGDIYYDSTALKLQIATA